MQTSRDDSPSDLPIANVREASDSLRHQTLTVFWAYRGWILLAVAVAVALIFTSVWARGPIVRVHFEEGHGIKPGDALKYRDIAVGQVSAVTLQPDGDGIVVALEMMNEARHLARTGTQFWIARPEVSLAGVRGLETVVGAKYVTMLPGPQEGDRATEFVGSETPIWLDNPGGTELVIDFREGWGLRIGAPLRFRSIDIGEVRAVALSEDLELVRVRIRLNTAGAEVARAGSRFWIERAAIGPTGVRGLNTLLTGSYVAVAPGSVEAEPQHYFVGIDEPPAARDRSPAGLEIILAGSHRRGLARGTTISYRGLAIGRVLSVGLAADSATVEARVYIDPQYKHLVRPESQFWYLPGFQMEAGVSGFDFHVDSLETLFRGGVAMATPEMTGPPVTTGRRFLLNSEPEEEWLEWNPTIAIGQLPELHRLPSPARARLSWQTRRLGFRRTEQELGWLLPIDTNHWLGLTTFLAPEGELREGCELELEGRVIALADASIDTLERVSRLHLPQWQPQHAQWPAARTRTPTKPEDCLVVTGNSSSQLPLAAGRLQPMEGGWSIDSSMAFDETDWQGAFVIATQDATLVGILSVEEGTGSVVFIPADVTKITR